MKSTTHTSLLSLLFLAVVATLTISTAAAEASENSSVYIKYEAPFENWTISEEGTASVQNNCGVDGKRSCFVLEGTESTSPMVSSPKIPDTMSGDTFLFSALFKCTGKARPYLGFFSMHYDYSEYVYTNNTAIGNDGWVETSVLLRLPEGSNRRMFFGIYYKEGTCYLDKIELTQAEVIPVADDPKYGLLGPEDSIKSDGTFESRIFENDFYSTINTHVKSISTGWNSNRAAFSDGKNITFDYTSIESQLAKPLTVEPNVNYVSTDAAFVTLMESSDGGETWSDVGTFGGKTGKFTFTLSSVKHSMFCFVMKDSVGSLQVLNVLVSSTVKDKPLATVHGKQLVHIPVEENGVSLSVAAKGDAKGKFSIQLANTMNTTVKDFVLDSSSVSPAGPTLTTDKSSGSINPEESMSITGEVRFSSSDDNVINYGIHSSDGSETYASGRFITSKVYFFDDENYGNYIDEDSGRGTLWWCGSTFKVSKHRSAPQKGTKKSAIDLYAAKNEYEAFQLILKASSSEQTISDVSITPLKSVDNSSVVVDDISVRRVMYVKTDYITDSAYGRAGEYWPDPLIPLDLPYKCPANENCLFWILVHPSFDAPEGKYKGTVSITVSGKKMSADVSLDVWNFTIPKKQRLKSLFGMNTNHINAYHHIKDANKTIRGLVYDKYFSSFSKHRISPTNSRPLNGYWTEFADDKLNLYYDDFIKRVSMTHSEDGFGFSSEVLNIYGMYSKLGGYEWGTAKHTELFDGNNALMQEVLRNNSLLDEFYVYWFDEPEESDYDYVIEGNDAIKRGGPDIKILLTEQVEEKLKGHVDAWCPVFANYVKGDLVERQKLGEEAWTYVCCCPTGNRITLFIDHPAAELRLWSWHTFKNNVDGLLLWATTYWSRNLTILQDPYTDVMSWCSSQEGQWGNGDGKFFYPPLKWNENTEEYILDDPIETIRLEILRDGIEDWEYFTTLKEVSKSKDATRKQKEIANKLLDIPDRIVGITDKEYAKTPEEMLSRRNEVGKFLNAYFCGEEYDPDDPDGQSASSFMRPVSFWAMVAMITVALMFHYL